MRTIPLTQSKIALVDDKDYVSLSRYKWHYVNVGSKRGYARTAQGGLYMHRVILGAVKKSDEVDHINRDTLDNRRDNIRLVDRTQNSYNKPLLKNNTSGVTGVTRTKSGKWQVKIWNRGKLYCFGTHSGFEDAVFARKKAFNRFAWC